MFSSTIKPYKFVNPNSIVSGGKGATIIAGGKKITGGSDSELKSSRGSLLSINRIGRTIYSLGMVQKQIRDIVEIDNKYLVGKQDFEKRKEQYLRDQQSEAKTESQGKGGGSDSEVKSETEKEVKKNSSWLEKLLSPFKAIIAFAGRIILTQGILRYVADPKNNEKLVRVVTGLSKVFGFLFNVASFSIDSLLTGFANVFGTDPNNPKTGLARFGEVLGGLGQVLVGIAGLAALRYLLNPFALVNDVLGLLDILDSKKKGDNCECGPSSKPGRDGLSSTRQMQKKLLQNPLFKNQRFGRNISNTNKLTGFGAVTTHGLGTSKQMQTVGGESVKKVFESLNNRGGGASKFLKRAALSGWISVQEARNIASKGIGFGQQTFRTVGAAGKNVWNNIGNISKGVLDKSKSLADGAGNWVKGAAGNVTKWAEAAKNPEALQKLVKETIQSKIEPQLKKNKFVSKLLDSIKNPGKIASGIGDLIKSSVKSPEVKTLSGILHEAKGKFKVAGIDTVIGALVALLDYTAFKTPIANALLGAIGATLGYAGGFALGAPFGGLPGFISGAAGGIAGEWIGKQLARALAGTVLGKTKDPIMNDGRMLASPELAEGGITTKPTLATIGEAGPEAIIPLSKLQGGGDATAAATIISASLGAFSKMGAAGEIAKQITAAEFSIASALFGLGNIQPASASESLGKSVAKASGAKSELSGDADLNKLIGEGSFNVSKGNYTNPMDNLRGALANILGVFMSLVSKDFKITTPTPTPPPGGGPPGGGPSGGGMLPGSAPPEVKAMLDAIAAAEGGWDSVNPGTTVAGLSKMTISKARQAAMSKGYSLHGSGAMGKWQQMPEFIIERAKSSGLNPDKDLFNEENQTKIARMLMAGVYPGGEKQLVKDARVSPLKASANLRGTWPSLPGGTQVNAHTKSFASTYQKRVESYTASQPPKASVGGKLGMDSFQPNITPNPKIDTPHIASQPKTKSPTVAATPHSRVRGASLSSTSSQVNHIEEVKTQQSTVTFLPIPINTSGNTAQAPSPGVQVIPARLPVTYGF